MEKRLGMLGRRGGAGRGREGCQREEQRREERGDGALRHRRVKWNARAQRLSVRTRSCAAGQCSAPHDERILVVWQKPQSCVHLPWSGA